MPLKARHDNRLASALELAWLRFDSTFEYPCMIYPGGNF